MPGYQDLLKALSTMGADQQPSFQVPGTLSAPAQSQPAFNTRDLLSAYNDESAARSRMQLAQALQGQGYIPNSGALGALAQIFSAYAGTRVQKEANEKLSDALARKFDIENKAAIQKIYAEADAKAKGAGAEAAAKSKAELDARTAAAQQLGLQGNDLKEYIANGKLEKSKLEMKDGIVFNPETGQSTIDPKVQQAIISQKAAERAPSEISQRIALAKQAGATPEQIQRMIVGEQAPAGYRPDGKGNLAAIPGGPADPNKPQPAPAEIRTKVGLLQNALGALDEFQKHAVAPDGSMNQLGARLPEAQRALQDAIGNKLRAESGAAISEKEVATEMARYAPALLSSSKTNVDALTRMRNDIQGQLKALTEGTTAALPSAQPAQAPGAKIDPADPLGIR